MLGVRRIGSPTGYDPVTGICNSTSRTDKQLLGLSSNTTYEWQMRVPPGNTPWQNGLTLQHLMIVQMLVI